MSTIYIISGDGKCFFVYDYFTDDYANYYDDEEGGAYMYIDGVRRYVAFLREPSPSGQNEKAMSSGSRPQAPRPQGGNLKPVASIRTKFPETWIWIDELSG